MGRYLNDERSEWLWAIAADFSIPVVAVYDGTNVATLRQVAANEIFIPCAPDR